MSAQAKIIFKNIVKVARESGALEKQITNIENKIIDQGLKLIEEAGIDTTLLPIDIRAVLRGESLNLNIDDILTPPIICAMPQMTPQQKELTTRKINDAREEIEQIYETTQAVKQQTLTLTGPLIKLEQSTSGIANSVEATSAIISLLKKLAVPTASPPGIGIPAGILNTFSTTLGTLGDLVKAASADLRTVPSAIGIMTGTINATISSLNNLNLILDPFLKLLTMVKSVVDLQDQCPLVSQGDINGIQALLLSNIEGNLAQADLFSGLGNDLEDRLQENSNNPYFYKNFQFILENEDPNPYFFPSRRIRCFRANSVGFNDDASGGALNISTRGGGDVVIYNNNRATNPNLPAGAFSYSSSLLILVAEAKFAVDVYTKNIKLFKAPLFRENVFIISPDGGINLADATPEELLEIAIFSGFESVNEFLSTTGYEVGTERTIPFPNYIIYGGTRVNLNSSPTDIEYGADALVQDGSYAGGTGIVLSSHIQSGVIQVNKPINLRLRTFGGTGNPITNINTGVTSPRFTESLLTIKRSAAIQDNVNPFTGRIEGFVDDGAIRSFTERYGLDAVATLDNVYQTSQERTGLNFGSATAYIPFDEENPPDPSEGIDGSTSYDEGIAFLNTPTTFIEQLEWVFNNWYAQGENAGEKRDKGDNVRRVIDILFSKSQQLLYNEDVLYLSKRLFGNKAANADIRTSDFKDLTLSPNYGDLVGYENWYWAARLNSSAEEIDRGSEGRANAKAATLGMLWYGLRQFNAKYTELYGDRTEYNNGAWISPGTGLPLIPGNVGPDNEDVSIILQTSQIAEEGTEINEMVGGLEILGTYTYNLEIIDSTPAIGGPDNNYPTNYTFFTVEDT